MCIRIARGFLLVLLGACSRGGDDGGAGVFAGSLAGASGALGGSGGAASLGGTGFDGGGPDAYRVSIHATETILCPGQCTGITATAENGHAPHSYAWNNGVSGGEGPHEICPEETTTYEVVATDTALVTEELGQPSQSASATLTIQVVGGDACELDGGVPAEQPERVLCSIAVPYEDPSGSPLLHLLSNGDALTTDHEGNLYFAGSYGAAIDLGDGLNPIAPTPSAFLAKYSPDCQPLWVKRYTIHNGGHSLRFNAVAVGPNGELVVGGWLLGTASFDGVTVSIAGFTASLLVAFDAADGTAFWAATPTSSVDSSGFYQVMFDRSGDLVVSGWTGSNAVLGDRVIGNATPGALIAKLTLAHEVRFAEVFAGAETFARAALSSKGAIAVSSISRQDPLLYGDEPVDVAFLHRYLALLDDQGALIWSRDLDLDVAPDGLATIGMAGFDSADNVLATHGNFTNEEPRAEVPETMTRFDPSGVSLGMRIVAPPDAPPGLQGTRFAIDALDNIVHLTRVDNLTDSPVDAGIRADGKVPGDVVVQKLAPNDASLIWRHRFDTDVLELGWGLTLGPDGSIWVGHGEDADADPLAGTLRITRLAP